MYIKGNPNKPLKSIPLSKSELNRKLKEGSVKIGKPHNNECWVKIGKEIWIIGNIDKKDFYNGYPPPALLAQIMFEYHYQLMPKKIKWTNLPLERVE